MKNLFIAIFAGLFLCAAASAGELADVKGGFKGRSNHAALYKDGCNACHTGNPKESVTDASCVQCHGAAASIEIDKRKLPLPEADPHKSIHYGQGVSCLACHSEHAKKAPVCTDCHRSWFGAK